MMNPPRFRTGSAIAGLAILSFSCDLALGAERAKLTVRFLRNCRAMKAAKVHQAIVVRLL
jgi:hypothetical protein